MAQTIQLPNQLQQHVQAQHQLQLLRIDIAKTVLGHLAEFDMIHAMQSAKQQRERFPTEGEDADAPLRFNPNPQQAAALSVVYADHLLVALGLATAG